MNSTGVVCHDAGGAEVVSNWVISQLKDIDFFFYLEGPAKTIFETNLPISFGDKLLGDLESLINKCETIVCGTSWSSNLEKNAMFAAKNANKKIIVVLDHWVNYRDRFQIGNGDLFIPDEVWVCDSFARKIAGEIFETRKIKQIPNFYIQKTREQIDLISASLNTEFKDIRQLKSVLYVCEPIKVHAKLQWGDENAHGYTEESALKFFLDNIQILGQYDRVVIRPHPSEPPTKYRWALDYYEGSIVIGGEKPLIQEILSADCVVGCESMALVIGLEAEKFVVSSIPPGGRKCRLPHEEIRHLQSLTEI